MILHLLRHFVGDAFNSLSTLHVYPLLIVFILCPPPIPPLGVTHDPHRINLLIPSSWCHIESRQSHRWAQRRQTARTTTPCSRSTCSTARGSSSPATLKYFERVVDIKHCNFPPEYFRHFNVGIFNKKVLNLNCSMLALPIVHQTPGN